MPVTTKILAQDFEDSQILLMRHNKRYITTTSDDWQMLFGPKSSITAPIFSVKIGVQYNSEEFNGVKFISYLYLPETGAVANASSCHFDVYRVSSPEWRDVPIYSFTGTQLSNYYYYKEIETDVLDITSAFQGETSLMIECKLVRLGKTYRDRVYINQLGIFKNCFNLKKENEFLFLTKVDE